MAGSLHAAVTIDLQVNPERVPADGTSTITVTAIVRDGGAPLDDASIVLFSTTQGDLLDLSGAGPAGQRLEVRVSAGRAKCLLRATTYETRAQLTAGVLGLPHIPTARAEAAFGLRAGPQQVQDNIIRVSGDYLAYAPESSVQIMEAIGNAVCVYRGVEVRANRIQLDLQDYILLAKDYGGGVILADGPPPYDDKQLRDSSKAPYSGEALAMNLLSFSGVLYSAQRGETVHFSGQQLVRQADRTVPTGAFDLYDLNDVKMWIRARKAAIYPHEKIRFDGARFYVQGTKVLGLPFHYEPLGYQASAGPALTQIINYSSQDGLLVDFPIVFEAGDLHSNQIRFSRGVRTGVFGRQTGFQLSYEHHEELSNNAGDWDLEVGEIGRTFGVYFQRQQRFNPYTYGSVAVAWPRHQDMFSTASMYTRLGPGNFSAALNTDYLSGFGGGLTNNTNLVWSANPMRMTSLDSNLGLSLGAGYSHTLGTNDFWRQSCALTVSKNPWRLGRGGSVQPYAGLRVQNTINGAQEAAFTFNATYRQTLTESMSLTLGYTFDTTWNSRFALPDRHLLTANWSLYTGGLWSGYAFASYNLGDRSLSASGLVDYALTPHWGLQAQSIYQTSSIGSFSETELWLYRLLGARELRLRYSLERSRLSFEIDNQF